MTPIADPPPPPLTTPADGRRRIEVYAMSGDLLPLTERYTNVLIHERTMRPDFELEELLQPCAVYLRWPLSHIRLVCGQITVRWRIRIGERTRTPCWHHGEHGVRRVTVVKEAMPEDFRACPRTNKCICEFGGCCRLCQVPVRALRHRGVCPGCGSGPGCCLCATCGCDCCEGKAPPVLPDDAPRCPFHGCQPEWAARWD